MPRPRLTPLERTVGRVHRWGAPVIIVAAILGVVTGYNWYWIFGAVAISLVVFVVLGLAEGILNLRSELRIRAADFLICPCGYDLRPHGEEGRCPECGRDYTGADLERLWTAAYPPHKTDSPVRALTGDCPACGYPLAGLPGAGRLRCPECGHTWRAARPPTRPRVDRD